MKQHVDRSAAVSRPPEGRGLDTTDRQRYSFDEDSLGPHFLFSQPQIYITKSGRNHRNFYIN